MRLLEDDSLGGGGSRGSGRVKIGNVRLAWRNAGFYRAGGAEEELATGADLAAVQGTLQDNVVGRLV
jgi:CRISPR-associated protein Csm3